MAISLDKTDDVWNDDIKRSVELYYSWYLEFAIDTFEKCRATTAETQNLGLVGV